MKTPRPASANLLPLTRWNTPAIDESIRRFGQAARERFGRMGEW
jgi:hypothetical protein